jgi:hypothetical protein
MFRIVPETPIRVQFNGASKSKGAERIKAESRSLCG